MSRKFRLHCALLSAYAAIVSCGPSTHKVNSGAISLTYIGRIDSGLEFDLANGSPDQISFLGRQSGRANTIPVSSKYALSCRAGSAGEVSGFAIEHGDDQAQIKLAGGQGMRLRIPSDSTTAAKGSRCALNLKLENGTMVVSDEFTQ